MLDLVLERADLTRQAAQIGVRGEVGEVQEIGRCAARAAPRRRHRAEQQHQRAAELLGAGDRLGAFAQRLLDRVERLTPAWIRRLRHIPRPRADRSCPTIGREPSIGDRTALVAEKGSDNFSPGRRSLGTRV